LLSFCGDLIVYRLIALVALLQADATVQISDDVVIHNGIDRLAAKRPFDIADARLLLLRLVSEQQYDDVAAELIRRYTQTANNRPVQMVTMGQLLSAVAEGRIKSPSSKEAVDGRSDRRFRAMCRPYVDAVTLPELSIPAAPALLDAQIKMVCIFQSNAEEVSREQVKERAELRKEYVRRLCLVWSRLIKSSLVYRHIYSEDMITGVVERNQPELPRILREFAAGISPEAIGDPVKRKAYEEYLFAVQQENDRYGAARRTSDLRKRHLSVIRRSLELMYGEDRFKWDELQKIANEIIKVPEVAQLVIKDFTRRKEPGIWP